MNQLRTIDDLDVEGQRVLLRADLDVPLSAEPAGRSPRIIDDARIRAALPTVEELQRRGARLVLASHLGHPKGPDRWLSLRPVAARLEQLTGTQVRLAPAVVGEEVRLLSEQLLPGQLLMLENVRFERGEGENDSGFAAALAELADVFVNDAFGCSHRAFASTESIAHALPSAAGRLMEHEVAALRAIVERPQRPLVVILGGVGLDIRIALVRRFLELADVVCLGGVVCLPFLAARGHAVRSAAWRVEVAELARVAMAAADGARGRLELPEDLLLAAPREANEGIRVRALDGVDIPHGWAALDVGRGTASRYAGEVARAATVFWSGPMGRFELAQFSSGTRRVARAVARASGATVVAGGHTIRALRSFGLERYVSHVSTGGPAALEFLEGRELPGVGPLTEAPVDYRRTLECPGGLGDRRAQRGACAIA